MTRYEFTARAYEQLTKEKPELDTPDMQTKIRALHFMSECVPQWHSRTL